MPSKLDILGWLSGAKMYIYIGIAALLVLLSTIVYVQQVKIDTRDAQLKAAKTELVVSNQSIEDLSKSLASVRNMLLAKEKEDLAKQAVIADNLAKIAVKDKTLEDMEARLKARGKPTNSVNCDVPKDLNDAWNSL